MSASGVLGSHHRTLQPFRSAALRSMAAILVMAAVTISTHATTSPMGAPTTRVPLKHTALASGSDTWGVQLDGFNVGGIS